MNTLRRILKLIKGMLFSSVAILFLGISVILLFDDEDKSIESSTHINEIGSVIKRFNILNEFNEIANSKKDSTFTIRFIDVGQADAALIECDGKYMLIDGGNKSDSSLMYSILKQEDIKHLEIIVATHMHEDHIGGLPGALNFATADLVLAPTLHYDGDTFEDFKRYVDLKGNGIVIPKVGDIYKFGSSSLEILGVNSGDEVNNSSIVLKIQYKENVFLFVGDAERETEQALLNAKVDLSADVLKVGHHGSDTSTTYPFLREVMPKYAVISVGKTNNYGHPTEATLSRLQDAEVKVFRTDLQGDIICTSNGKDIEFNVEKNKEIDTFKTNSIIGNNLNSNSNIENGTIAAYDYVLNKSTMKFHYSSCSSVKKIKQNNRFDYNGTRDEIIAKGYNPCGSCHP